MTTRRFRPRASDRRELQPSEFGIPPLAARLGEAAPWPLRTLSPALRTTAAGAKLLRIGNAKAPLFARRPMSGARRWGEFEIHPCSALQLKPDPGSWHVVVADSTMYASFSRFAFSHTQCDRADCKLALPVATTPQPHFGRYLKCLALARPANARETWCERLSSELINAVEKDGFQICGSFVQKAWNGAFEMEDIRIVLCSCFDSSLHRISTPIIPLLLHTLHLKQPSYFI